MPRRAADGNAVQLIASAAHSKGDYVVEGGFHGLVMNDCQQGEIVVLDISRGLIEDVPLSGVAAGDELWMPVGGGAITNAPGSASGDHYLVGIATRDTDASGTCAFRQAEQGIVRTF